MLLRNAWKICLIAVLSSCAGKPPKLEKKIAVYNGHPDRGAMCRTANERVLQIALRAAKYQITKQELPKILRAGLKADNPECVYVYEPRFAQMMGLPVEDLVALLKYQEQLIFSCERWKQ